MNQRIRTAGGVSLLITALAAFPALAACPSTPEDAKKGIQFKFDDGSSSEVFLRDGGLIEEWSMSAEADEYGLNDSVTVSQHGVWLTEIADVVDGKIQEETRSVMTYTEGGAEIGPFGPGREWRGAGIWDEGTELEAHETHLITSGQETTLPIGPCSYTIYPIRIEYNANGERFTDFLFAFPELGITAFVGSQSGYEFWNPKILSIETLG